MGNGNPIKHIPVTVKTATDSIVKTVLTDTLWGVSKTGPLRSLSIGVQSKIFNNNGNIKIAGGDILGTMRMRTTSAYRGVDSRYLAFSETQVIRVSFTYNFGRKQVKAERERSTALEEESGRVKVKD